jgi:hypothetical protein
MIEKRYIKKTQNWWLCENTVNPAYKGQIGVLSLNEPKVFVLVQNSDELFMSYDHFKNNLAQVNLLQPTDINYNIDEILFDAYEFLSLHNC